MSDKSERRILSLKTDLALSLIFIFSIGLYWLFFNLDGKSFPYLKQISRLLADSFLVVSIIGYIYEKILRQETEEKISSDMNQALKRLKNEIPEILTNTIIFGKEFQKNLLSDSNIDEIFLSCLECKLQDERMAVELRKSFFQEIFKYKERWYNLVHYISFQECDIEELNPSERDKLLIFKDHISYKMLWSKNNFKFICSKINIDSDRYMKDETYYSTWHLRAAFPSNLRKPYFFVEKLKINEHLLQLNIVNERQDFIEVEGYHEKLIDLIGKKVQVDYVVKSLVRKSSNSFNIKIPVPTKDLRVTFDIQNTGMQRLTVVPFFTSKTAIQKNTDDELNPKLFEIYLSDWVFPISGITCIWQNESI